MLYTTFLALTATPWYGPASVSFDLATSGSAYDASTNDVEVRFTSGSTSEERPAYFDGQRWKAVLLAHKPGSYMATVIENGKESKRLPGQINVDAASTTSFVRVDKSRRSFTLDSGVSYWPIGHDLGWQDPALPPLTEQIAQMGQDGMNWSRIWACAWDGKNPYWPQDNHKLPDYDLDQGVFKKWDAIIAAADKAGIRFQWVVFHHGEFSSQVDPNWPQNPWNAANGGFLKDPKQFFTDPEAIKRAKSLLHYLVARYGHEPSIMSWELFNEVENTDAARAGDWEDIGQWHKQMADYLRSIDPYHHLITSSSELRKELTDPLDYYQPHGYPASVSAMLLSAPVLTDKPFFFGEVGLGGGHPTEADQRQTIRDAIWSALLAGHSGSAEFWYWDAVYKDKLGPEYAHAAKILKEMRVTPGPEVEPAQVQIESPLGGDLKLSPGLSWAPSTKTSFQLPSEGNALGMGHLSSFLQGTNHKDMGSIVTFDFDAPADGKFGLSLGTAARQGASLDIGVDGKEVLKKDWPQQPKDTPVDQQFEIPYSKGHHRLVVSNTGPDWVQVNSYRFTGIGTAASGSVSSENGALFGRIHRNSAKRTTFTLTGLSIPDGQALLKTWDLDSTQDKSENVVVKGGVLSESVDLNGTDMIFLLRSAG